jgi:4-hydroxybenzoate polyprenyltransferase
MLNPLCFYLSPLPLAIFILYSYTKRFTFLCHIVLGVALGIAPIGAWAAVQGSINLPISLLGLAVLFWAAGFDIIYACQDIDFDRKENLHSIPRYIGVKGSLYTARALHIGAFTLFAYTGAAFGLGFIYFAGVTLTGLFMVYEHSLIKPHDLSKVDMAFFNLNAYISVTIFLFTAADIFI